jgi:hypothetical protein
MKTYVKPVPKMGHLFSEGRGVVRNTALVEGCKGSRSVNITALRTISLMGPEEFGFIINLW